MVYFCIDNETKQTLKTTTTMTNSINISDNEIMAIMNKAMKEAFSTVDLQDKVREQKRRVKADFFNLNATDYCRFE